MGLSTWKNAPEGRLGRILKSDAQIANTNLGIEGYIKILNLIYQKIRKNSNWLF